MQIFTRSWQQFAASRGNRRVGGMFARSGAGCRLLCGMDFCVIYSLICGMVCGVHGFLRRALRLSHQARQAVLPGLVRCRIIGQAVAFRTEGKRPKPAAIASRHIAVLL